MGWLICLQVLIRAVKANLCLKLAWSKGRQPLGPNFQLVHMYLCRQAIYFGTSLTGREITPVFGRFGLLLYD